MGRRGGSSSLVRQIGVTKPLLSHLKVVSATPIWSFCGGLATPNHLIVVLASPICGQTTPYIYIYIHLLSLFLFFFFFFFFFTLYHTAIFWSLGGQMSPAMYVTDILSKKEKKLDGGANMS
jgi:sterol desaturase/sphingolipid hydroxylase (fatty acid hydroxylase superfamily)